MNATRFLLGLLLCLLPSLALAGTAHYVDCSAGTNGSGSYASPWNNLPSVKTHSFDTGDDVYFKVDVTCDLAARSDRVQIDWSGTSEDRVVIGCYDGDSDFDCGATPYVDGNRAVFDGDSDDDGDGDYPPSHHYVVQVMNQSYVTIQELAFFYVGDSEGTGTTAIATGTSTGHSDHVNVDNNYIYRPGGQGIGVFKTDTGTISNNYIFNTGYPDYAGSGAALEVSSLNEEAATTNITVTRNTVRSGKNEGIGLYKKTTHSVVEHNVVFDIRTAHIYIDSGENNTVRYNLVYNLAKGERTFPGSTGGYGIALQEESFNNFCFGGYNEVYGNTIGGMHMGIVLSCQINQCYEVGAAVADCKGDFTSCICHENTKIYANTLVDNEWNIKNWSPAAGDSVQIRNNISRIHTETGPWGPFRHVDPESPAGVTWSHNSYFGNPGSVTLPGGNADDSGVDGDPKLLKQSGWRSLSAGSLNGTEFSLTTGSSAIDAGLSIASYNVRIFDADFTASPTVVNTAVDDVPDIGAWMYAVPVTCADLGGVDCCTGSQTCPGTDLGVSSDCADVCCSETCTAPTCQGQGYQCCDACGSGAHPQYDGDCPGQVCCEACEVCSDGTCNGSETCQSCPQDCPTGAGEVCCSGVIYTGDCCEDGDCHDGNLCNGEESCSAGACQSGTPLDCDDGDPCTKDLCVPATGCEHTPDTSGECADYEPEGSCGCGFGATGPGEAGIRLLLLFMLAFALRHRLSKSRSKMLCSF